MRHDNWKINEWLGLKHDEGLTDPEMKQIVDAVEKARAKIERPDYVQTADNVMLIQYGLALAMQDLLKREALYANGGGWCLGRVHADIAQCHDLQDKYSRCFETIMKFD